MTLNNAGNEVVWRDVDMSIEVNESSLRNDRMRVCVHDENTSCRDTILGTGYANIIPLCAAVGEKRTVEVGLVDKKGSRCGSVVMTIVLQPSRMQVHKIGNWVFCTLFSIPLHHTTHNPF